MTVLNWSLLRAVRPELNVEQADESELQQIEDAAEELAKVDRVEEIGEVRDLQTAFGVAQKIIRLKSMQAEAAIEELETTMKNSTLAQENERLRRDLARARRGDLEGEDQVKKLRDEIEDLQISLRREKQSLTRLESLYADADRDRKSLQVEVLALQSELDEKIKDVQKNEIHAASQVTERQYIAKLKEKNDQITKLMLALQEEENVNEDLRSTIEQLGAKLRDATVEIDQSADLIEELQRVRQTLTSQGEQNRREIATLEGLVDEYMDKINELEALQPPDMIRNNSSADSKNTSSDRLETWREILESKNCQIHQLESKCVQLERELETVLSSSNTLTLNILKRAITEKDEQIKSLAGSLTQATQDIEDNARFIEDLKRELSDKGDHRVDEKAFRASLRKLEEDNSQLEKQLLDREEQLAEALLIAKKYEMGVYGLSDAVTEVRVCKRKIAARDKNILRLQEQMAESYVEIERLKTENENLCQGIPPSRAKPSSSRRNSIEAEKTILALEEEILELKQSLRNLQKNLVDKVHEVSAGWDNSSDMQTRSNEQDISRSFDEDNFDRCQISRTPSEKRREVADGKSADETAHNTEMISENQQLKEFLIYVLESLQTINQHRSDKLKEDHPETRAKDPTSPSKRRRASANAENMSENPSGSPPKVELRPRSKLAKKPRVSSAKVRRARKENIDWLSELPIDFRMLKEFVRDILEENHSLVRDIGSLRESLTRDSSDQLLSKMFVSAQQQLLKQNAIISTYSGVVAEQMEYIDCIQEMYSRQVKALKSDARLAQPELSYTISFDYVAELKHQIKLLNEDIVHMKNNILNENPDAFDAKSIAHEDQTENMFLIEKLGMQVESLSQQYLKSQRLATERQNELLRLYEQTHQNVPVARELPASDQNKGREQNRSNDSDIDSSMEEESQTESERSMCQSFYKRMDSLRDYNRKLCTELADAKYILRRTQDALRLKETMLREVNKQHITHGNLEQKLKVMEISLDTTKKLLGHKEQTLERYRQLVTDLKQDLISTKVKRNSDVQELERKHMKDMYLAKKQIAEITMRAFQQQKKLALNDDAVTDQTTFEKILAEKQVAILQLQNKLKASQSNEIFLQNQFDQIRGTNASLNENIHELREKLRAAERSTQVTVSMPEIVTTPEVVSREDPQPSEESDEEETESKKLVEDLRGKLEVAEDRAAKLKRANEAAKERICALESEIEQQNTKIEQLRKIQKLKRADPKRMKILEDEVDSLRRQLSDLKQQQSEKPSEDAVKHIKQSIEVARWEESKKWQTLVETFREQLKTKSTAIEQLESARNALKNQILRLEKEKYALTDRLKAGLNVGPENTQAIEALMRKVTSQERLILSLQERAQHKTRRKPKENQIVPILVSPKTPRRHKGARSVSFDASVVDNEAMTGDEA
ncbi:centrosomal protein of 290 kDa-like [Galendromus occidentalis]|uniref:Centrosomal protein of 290 kDa-like n=1 Tax=Galendromus occidentalis TaxID=34638 RepID=A0AAJ7L6L8_9ACAR|nr:centrosomal protein of 290 kDa-like [Galendromus occidentalis]